MSEDPESFTEAELEALAREHGKPLRKGFENDVLQKVRFLEKEHKSGTAPSEGEKRREELRNAADSGEQSSLEQDPEM